MTKESARFLIKRCDYFRRTERGKKTTKYGKHRKRTACEGRKPQNTQNTQKKDCMLGESTENTDHTKKHCMWGFTAQMPFPTAVDWLIHAGRGSAGGAPPHSYEWCRRVRRHPASLTKSLPLLWYQWTRLHKSPAYKRRGHPEPRRCASAKAREIPHPTEGRRHPVSTRRASAGCGACRTQSCLRGVGAKPAPTFSPLSPHLPLSPNPQHRRCG